MTVLGQLRRRAFGVPSPKSVFSRPGFAPEAWERFAPVAVSLVGGYHAALEESHIDMLRRRLDDVEPSLTGIAYEGAGMGLAALDVLAPHRNRVAELVDGPGARHIYPTYVGVGLAYARLRQSPEARLSRLDPLLGWVTADGYGFHEAFFRRRRYVDRHASPDHLSAVARPYFDQGIGRALWFSGGAVVERIAAQIGGFVPARRAGLWCGVGLASAYGGGTDAAGLGAVLDHAQEFRPQLARGAATAAWGRQMAGNLVPHTHLACEVYCGVPAEDAAAAVTEAAEGLPAVSVEPAYTTWCRRIEQTLVQRSAAPRGPAQ
ncbi:MAG: DUF1702 family protein [Pseudonocardia sp.]